MMRDRPFPGVMLVSMPWVSTSFPALGIGTLVAAARRSGFTCEGWYPNLEFSSIIGSEFYEWIASEAELFPLAEHLFAVDMFGADALDSDTFLDSVCDGTAAGTAAGSSSLALDTLVTLRDGVVPAFLDDCLEYLLSAKPDVVGFSCVFNQALPSLALARRLKRERPATVVLLGGGLMHGPMGPAYARAFCDCVDHVFNGEADVVFPRYLETVRRGGDVREVPGLTVDGELTAPAPLIVAMDDLPVPEFDDYFSARQRLTAAGLRLSPNHNLPYESARGCWWGEKHHCVFCGLNTEGMRFREKSAERVINELTELSQRYSITTFAAADNILARHGYDTLLPRLAALGLDLHLFYEIKANVTRNDVAALKRAGVEWLVPGLESFSDHVLQLMRKGTQAVQNIQLLKWLQEFGIEPFYNILVGFPGESHDDFEQMKRLLPSLFHLPAPSFGHGRANLAQVHRFAPFFDDAEGLGLGKIRAGWFYRHIIPPEVLPGEEYGYFFERDIPTDAPLRRHWDELNALLDAWRAHRGGLWADLGAGFVRIWREGKTVATVAVLDREAALIFVLADAKTSRAGLERDVERWCPGCAVDVQATVAELLELGVLVEVGGKIVNVVPLRRARTQEQLQEWVARWVMPRAAPTRAMAEAWAGPSAGS